MSAEEVVALPNCSERLDIACDAAWEIESLAGLLQYAASTDDGALALRGITMRMQALACIVMGAVSDPNDPLCDLQYRLIGRASPASVE